LTPGSATAHDVGVASSSSDGPTRRRRREGVPSIRDVAAVAGVSYQTVSRVLNDSPNVHPDTRQLVIDAMSRLAYRPNRAARALGSGRAGAVTVVTADTMLYGYAATLQGIEEAARLRGLAVGIRVVESTGPDDVRHAVEHVSDPSAGGVIVVAFDAAGAGVLRALPPDVPVVAATEAGGLAGTPRTMIFLDERQAAADATRHLLTLGHRTVHHVAIPSETGTSARQAGWRDALKDAGAEVPTVLHGGWDPHSAYLAGQRLAADAQVTAILCGNDDTAMAVRRALYEAGRDVPGDVSLVGFDDVPGAAYWTPALTTVRMDFVALGRACLAAVVAEVTGVPQPDLGLAAPRLVIRESTAPPA
jgi:DNA-binding LacI/PurR family transcriptional regulator